MVTQLRNTKPRFAEPIRFSETLQAPSDVIRASFHESGGRSGAWVKLRVNQGEELVMGCYTPAEQRRPCPTPPRVYFRHNQAWGMTAIPLACLGGVLALVLTHTPFSVSAGVALCAFPTVKPFHASAG